MTLILSAIFTGRTDIHKIYSSFTNYINDQFEPIFLLEKVENGQSLQFPVFGVNLAKTKSFGSWCLYSTDNI